ncbi:hypothetical protein [Thiomicrorhabdus sp.]|uniref:hypothetical protein n=1 Tax=Thiomicrorhabdus sp. TaxID=2039724 RepID=UPI002AA6DC75|nr:hypothetical protein [Thiomicrorhabdus sp.]
MSSIQNQNIVLLGLPGSGKSKVAQALQNQFGCKVLFKEDVKVENKQIQFTRPGSYEWHDLDCLPDLLTQNLGGIGFCDVHVYCIIDIRSVLPMETLLWANNMLQKMINVADGIVFSFSENSSLNDQAWWGSWIKKQTANSQIPIVRMLNQNLPSNFSGFEKRAVGQVNVADDVTVDNKGLDNSTNNQLTEQKNECFDFTLERVMLDHLLMVLDNARQNHGINITRVTGVLNTFEYANLVQIEGTPYRWDTFAADSEEKIGTLTVCGTGLNQAWLTEMIQACKV